MIRQVALPLLPLITVVGCIYGGWVARGMWERERYQRDVLEGRAPAPWEFAATLDDLRARVAMFDDDEISPDGYARSGDGAFWPEIRRGIFDDESGTYV